MKYKEGDKVRIKSLDWYYKKCDDFGNVDCGFYYFTKYMTEFCGKEATIKDIYRNNRFSISEDLGRYIWTSEMFECINENTKNEKMINIKDASKICSLVTSTLFPNMFRCGEEIKELEDKFRKAMEDRWEQD